MSMSIDSDAAAGAAYEFPILPDSEIPQGEDDLPLSKNPLSELFWALRGISKEYRDSGFRYYDETNRDAVFEEFYGWADDKFKHTKDDAQTKMRLGPGILQLRSVIRGLKEDRPLFPQIRPNEAIQNRRSYHWHGGDSGEVAPFYFVDNGRSDRLYIPKRFGVDGGYRELIKSGRVHDHDTAYLRTRTRTRNGETVLEEFVDEALLDKHIDTDHSGDGTVSGSHTHDENIVGDAWFSVLTDRWKHVHKESDTKNGKNYGGHDSVNVEGVHAHGDEGKYQLPPNKLVPVDRPAKLHSKMGEGERLSHIKSWHEDNPDIGLDEEHTHEYEVRAFLLETRPAKLHGRMGAKERERHVLNQHGGEDPGDEAEHSHVHEVNDRSYDQAARICTTPLLAGDDDELMRRVVESGLCFIAYEGSLKGAALAAAGYAVIITASVTTWVCQELEAVCRLMPEGTVMIIIPDADWTLNDMVVNQCTLFKVTIESYNPALGVMIAAPPIKWGMYQQFMAARKDNFYLTKKEFFEDEDEDFEAMFINGKGIDDYLGTGAQIGDLDTLAAELPDWRPILAYIDAFRRELLSEDDFTEYRRCKRSGKPFAGPKRGLQKGGVTRMTALVVNLARHAGYTDGTFAATAGVIAKVMQFKGDHSRNEVPRYLYNLQLLGIISVKAGDVDKPLSRGYKGMGGLQFSGTSPLITLSDERDRDGVYVYRATVLPKATPLAVALSAYNLPTTFERRDDENGHDHEDH